MDPQEAMLQQLALFATGVAELSNAKRKRKTEDESKDKVKKLKGVKNRGKRFQALIKIDSKENYLGTFDTPKEAAEAYDRAAIQAGRPASQLNFVNQVPKNYTPKMKKLGPRNTTGFRGVSKRGDRFISQIQIDGKQRHIGNFATLKQAAIGFDLAAIQEKRPKSDLNFPDMIHNKNKTILLPNRTRGRPKKGSTKKKVPIIKIKKKRKTSTTKSNNNSSMGGGRVSREFPIIRT